MTQEVIAGLIKRITFHNAENGFCIQRAKVRGHRDLATIVGRAAIISAAERITASGEWINDRAPRRAWFRYFDPATLPSPSYATRIMQSWDIAMQTNEKNDYSVCTTWRVEKNDVYLFDLFRGRLEYPIFAGRSSPSPNTTARPSS